MLVKGIIDEDFVNYKKPCMTIMFPKCDFKCDKECGMPVCQNSELVKQPDIKITYDELLERYINNNITEALVLQGLEPMDSFSDVINLILWLRFKYKCEHDVVVYTGYNKTEIDWFLEKIIGIKNIVFKYGRYIPNQQPHYDEVLGVMLASDNQYAERIS